MSPREKELLDRIRQLEEQNSALQDKLDMIWALLAPEYDPDLAEEDLAEEGLAEDDAQQPGPRLVQIDSPGKKPHQ